MVKFFRFFFKLGLILLILWAGYYFLGNYLLKTYNGNLKKFEEIDFGGILNEIKKEVLAPSPLNVGGQANEVVLVKAKIIAQTNIQRYNNGILSPLIENTKLDATALAKANDMFAKQYFDHVSPFGVGPGDLVRSYGYDYIVTGENLILGNFKNETEVVQLWMDSPGHRANILNERFTEIGVAIIRGVYDSKTVWIGVQEFGLPLSNCDQPDQNLKGQITANENTLDQMLLKINEKKAELDGSNRRSEKHSQLVKEYNQLVEQYNALVKETKALISQYNAQVSLFNECVVGE